MLQGDAVGVGCRAPRAEPSDQFHVSHSHVAQHLKEVGHKPVSQTKQKRINSDQHTLTLAHTRTRTRGGGGD